MTAKTVTISCRITPEQKLKLAQRSEKLGMKLCHYIELLVWNQFENDLKTVHYSENENENGFENENENEIENQPTFQSVILAETNNENQVSIFDKKMEVLKKRHKNIAPSEIVNACLIHAIENRRAIIQRPLSIFINRLKKRTYDN